MPKLRLLLKSLLLFSAEAETFTLLNKTCLLLFDCSTASPDTTALYSEITMYLLLVFLTSWLLVEMVYCYRKISRSDEQPPDAA